MVFVVPSFLSSQTPAGRGRWSPFLVLVLPEDFPVKREFFFPQSLVYAQGGGLDRREVWMQSLGFLSEATFLKIGSVCMN